MKKIVGVSADGNYNHGQAPGTSGVNSYVVLFIGWNHPSSVCNMPPGPCSVECSALIHAEQRTFDCPSGQIVGYQIIDDLMNDGPEGVKLDDADMAVTTEVPKE